MILQVSLLFPNVLVPGLSEYSFLPFAVLLIIFMVFVWFALPETKGKQAGETSQLIQVNKCMVWFVCFGLVFSTRDKG